MTEAFVCGSVLQTGTVFLGRSLRNIPQVRISGTMPNVRAANKVKIGAWMDRMDVGRLRDFAASQGLHLSSLIEATVLSALPRLMADAARAREVEQMGFESGGEGGTEYAEYTDGDSMRRDSGRGNGALFLDAGVSVH